MSEALRQEWNPRGSRSEAVHAQSRAWVEETIRRMDVSPRDRILDVGCGEGWPTRRLAALAPQGSVIGLDMSDEMIYRAREQSAAFENVLFLWASAEQIPWQENFFTKALCVDALYYFENVERALHEIHRVLAPGGSFWILNYLSQENELSPRWISELKAPAQVLSAEEYGALLQRCGYEQFSHRMLADVQPIPADTPPAPFPDAPELRRCYEIGALLLTARKPSGPRP